MSHVFVSYKRHENDDLIDALIDAIEEKNFVVWTDRKITPGEDWRETIDNALKECFAVVVVITPGSMKSKYVTYEWAFAMGLSKPIIPVMAIKTPLDSIHPKLEIIQYIDFCNESKRASEVEKLLLQLDIYKNRLGHSDTQIAIQHAIRDSSLADVVTRRKAIESLSQVSDEEPRNEALAARVANATYVDVRINAAMHLAYLTNSEDLRALPGLVEALDELSMTGPELDTVVSYVEQYERDLVIDYLIRALLAGNGGDGVRKMLGTLKDRRAVSALIEDLKHGGDARATLDALGEIGDESAIDSLHDLLNQELAQDSDNIDTMFCASVARTLGEIGSSKSASILVKLFVRFVERYGNSNPYVHYEIGNPISVCKTALMSIDRESVLPLLEEARKNSGDALVARDADQLTSPHELGLDGSSGAHAIVPPDIDQLMSPYSPLPPPPPPASTTVQMIDDLIEEIRGRTANNHTRRSGRSLSEL